MMDVAGRDYIQAAKAEGRALVEDGGMVYATDSAGCGCGTAEESGGRNGERHWAFHFAATVGGADRETAAGGPLRDEGRKTLTENGRCNGHHPPRLDRATKSFAELGILGVFDRVARECAIEDLVLYGGVCMEEAERAYDAHGDDYEAAKDRLLCAGLERLLSAGGER